MNYDSKTPIYLQIIRSMEEKIAAGELSAGQRLPSGRDLAVEYKINPNTASRVYTELERLGLCATRRGLGTYVTEDEERIQKLRYELAEDLIQSFLRGAERIGLSRSEIRQMMKHNA